MTYVGSMGFFVGRLLRGKIRPDTDAGATSWPAEPFLIAFSTAEPREARKPATMFCKGFAAVNAPVRR